MAVGQYYYRLTLPKVPAVLGAECMYSCTGLKLQLTVLVLGGDGWDLNVVDLGCEFLMPKSQKTRIKRVFTVVLIYDAYM